MLSLSTASRASSYAGYEDTTCAENLGRWRGGLASIGGLSSFPLLGLTASVGIMVAFLCKHPRASSDTPSHPALSKMFRTCSFDHPFQCPCVAIIEPKEEVHSRSSPLISCRLVIVIFFASWGVGSGIACDGALATKYRLNVAYLLLQVLPSLCGRSAGNGDRRRCDSGGVAFGSVIVDWRQRLASDMIVDQTERRSASPFYGNM
ncbi:hypothetical protein CPC08DRAFT_768236 [Agrocybe pediades]|nr:hypothetical protein CPC08DRAFT_768236 [Agrocybe pediades]